MITDSIQALSNPERLAALHRTGLLDTPPEAAFDRFTKLASKITGAPVALLSLVDKDRQFFKSCVGLEEPWAGERETSLLLSFCQHIVLSGEPIVIADAREHPLVHDNLAIEALGVVAYAGVPLRTVEGHTLGSFCAIDHEPRKWTQKEVEILTDLAALIMTEIELRIAARQLQENYSRLHELEALRDGLTHMIVHDLRTPLASLISGLHMVKELGGLNNVQEECVAISSRGAETLLRMINDLLDISKMESGQFSLEYTEVAPADIVQLALEQAAQLAARSGVTLTSEVASDLPTAIVDVDTLRRTLINLLGNSIKFSPEGGQVTICVQAAENGKSLLFAVADNGPGIPEEEFERVFEKFGQVQLRSAASGMSTGLGLPFCKMVVEAHGGRIWLESKVQCGSTFKFIIPSRPGNATSKEQAEGGAHSHQAHSQEVTSELAP